MMRKDRAVLVGAMGASCLIAFSCGGGSAPLTTTTTTTRPPVPNPTPTPVGYGCPFGAGTVETACTHNKSSNLLDAVGASIDLLATQSSKAINPADQAGAGSYKVVDPKAFIDGVVANLQAAGMCAQADYDFPLERINVKNSNDFSEDFDLILSTGYVRRGAGAYRQTCTPAAFPVTPDPSWPPSGSGCGKPYPPPITGWNSKVYLHVPYPGYDTLDSTALVGPDPGYCSLIGFSDGRSMCPVRINGDPEREACEAWAVGKAQDTGRPGPTWTNPNHENCLGLTVNGCENHPNNQYELLVYTGGKYKMCAENGICGKVVDDQR